MNLGRKTIKMILKSYRDLKPFLMIIKVMIFVSDLRMKNKENEDV